MLRRYMFQQKRLEREMSDLRLLMKAAAAKTEYARAAQLADGKEKARMLKAMKNEQKLEISANNKHVKSSSHSTEAFALSGSNHRDAGIINGGTGKLGLAAKQSKVETSIPVGFFDNPIDELVARGVSVEKHMAERERAANDEVGAFLQSVKEFDVDEEKEEFESADMKDMDETVIQMAYMAKLAGLLQKSESVMPQAAESRSQQSAITEINEMVEDSEALLGILERADGEMGRERESSVRSDVESILTKKLAASHSKKRKFTSTTAKVSAQKKSSSKNDDDDSNEESDKVTADYSPLAFMKWKPHSRK